MKKDLNLFFLLFFLITILSKYQVVFAESTKPFNIFTKGELTFIPSKKILSFYLKIYPKNKDKNFLLERIALPLDTLINTIKINASNIVPEIRKDKLDEEVEIKYPTTVNFEMIEISYKILLKKEDNIYLKNISPTIDSLIYPTTFVIKILSPKGYIVIMPGFKKLIKKNGDSIFVFRSNHCSVDEVSMLICKDNYIETSFHRKELPKTIYIYLHNQFVTELSKVQLSIKEAFKFLSLYLSSFPYETIHILIGKDEEVLSLTMRGYLGFSVPGIIVLCTGYLKYALSQKFIHELSHQWETDEGFACFFEYEYFITKSKVGNWKNVFFTIEKDYHELIKKNKDIPLITASRGYFEIQRTKGILVLKMLENLLGKDIFKKITKKFFPTRYFLSGEERKMGIERFKKIAEDVSAQDLDEFFNFWFYKTGGIKICVDKLYCIKKTNNKYIIHLNLKEPLPRFINVLEIKIYNEKVKMIYTLRIKENQREFLIPVNFRPKYLKFDPNAKFLMNNSETRYLQVVTFINKG